MHTEPQTPPATARARRLDELTWDEVVDWLRRDPRLLLPVGSCTRHGLHLPLGTDTRIAARLANDVCVRTGILLAPLLPFGVVSSDDLAYAGSTGLERKTLHRVLNELVESWERQGLHEITLLTTNGSPRNIQALAMVIGDTVRVRSVDTRAIDVSHLLESPPDTGEFEISLMLHLAPALVRREKDGSEIPSAATATKGQNLYDHLLSTIVGRLGALDP